MASIYDLKPAFQSLLRPLCRALAAAGVSANAVTLFAMAASIGMGAWIASMPGSAVPLIAVGPFLFLRMALNAIDGMLAREHDQKTALGAWLNETGDVVSDAGLYLPLALVAPFPPTWTVCAVVLALISEMGGVVSVQMGASRRYDGPMGKSDRAFVFGLTALLVGLEVMTETVCLGILVAVNLLLVLTCLNRLRRTLGELRADDA